MTALVFARDGILYTGHISGMVRRWELPLAGSSEDGDEAPQLQAAAAAQQQQPSQATAAETERP